MYICVNFCRYRGIGMVSNVYTKAFIQTHTQTHMPASVSSLFLSPEKSWGSILHVIHTSSGIVSMYYKHHDVVEALSPESCK